MENHYNNGNKNDQKAGPSCGQKRSLEDEPYRHPKRQKGSSTSEESGVDSSLGSPYYSSEEYSEVTSLEEEEDGNQRLVKKRKLNSDDANVEIITAICEGVLKSVKLNKNMMASRYKKSVDSTSSNCSETDFEKDRDV